MRTEEQKSEFRSQKSEATARMFLGSIMSSSLGDWRDSVVSLRVWRFGGGVKFSLTPLDSIRGSFIAIFINGRWTGKNYFVPLSGDIEDVLPLDFGDGGASIFVVEVGDAATFDPSFIPAEMAQYEDGLTAMRLRFMWSGSYRLTPVTGDTQLAAIVVAGALRGVNTARVDDLASRGRLHYTILTVGTTHFVRWWNDGVLVAEGSRVGNGAVVCAEIDESGLSVACTLTYTADVLPDVAWLDVRWPQSYQIHYSTGALTYPRTPEATLTDDGATSFQFLTPVLAAGSYNYNVLQVDDDGVLQTTIAAPADSPLTLNSAPAAPTITGVTWSPFTLNWTAGEAGCTYTVYYSQPNWPINWGQFDDPAPVVTALNAPSAVLDDSFDYSSVDNGGDYDDANVAFDAVATALNTAFDAGETDFTSDWGAQIAAALAAVAALGTALGKDLRSLSGLIVDAQLVLQGVLDGVAGEGLSTDDWKLAVGPNYGNLLTLLSALIQGDGSRYALPTGAVAGASEALAENLYTVSLPFAKPSITRLVVRATKGGIEERNDQVYSVEHAGGGTPRLPRPNKAEILGITFAGLTAAIVAGVLEENAAAAATKVYLFVDGGEVTHATLAAADETGAHQATISYALTEGWHVIFVKAKTAAGQYSDVWKAQWIYVTDDAAEAVTGLSAMVVRGRG